MLSVLQAAPEDIRVVRAVEPNVEAVAALCAEKGIALSADYADALADPAVEAVVLATPHALHSEQIEAAVAAGKHVFCEKPLALTKAGAEKAVALCRDAGLVLGMGHERRWEPPIAEMLAKADAGELGRIHQIEANFSHDKFLALDRDNWRLQGRSGARRRHDGDGHPSARPVGAAAGAGGKRAVHLRAAVVGPAAGRHGRGLRQVRGGGTSYVSASLANPFMSRFTVYGSKGWIDIRDKAHVEAPDGWIVTSAMAGGPITTVELPPAEPVKDNLVAFARAVRGEADYPITAEHLVNNIALLEAVFASALSGKIEAVA